MFSRHDSRHRVSSTLCPSSDLTDHWYELESTRRSIVVIEGMGCYSCCLSRTRRSCPRRCQVQTQTATNCREQNETIQKVSRSWQHRWVMPHFISPQIAGPFRVSRIATKKRTNFQWTSYLNQWQRNALRVRLFGSTEKVSHRLCAISVCPNDTSIREKTSDQICPSCCVRRPKLVSTFLEENVVDERNINAEYQVSERRIRCLTTTLFAAAARNWKARRQNTIHPNTKKSTVLITDTRIFALEGPVSEHGSSSSVPDSRCSPLTLGDSTAVRLQGDHRTHDYINANEIKVNRRWFGPSRSVVVSVGSDQQKGIHRLSGPVEGHLPGFLGDHSSISVIEDSHANENGREESTQSTANDRKNPSRRRYCQSLVYPFRVNVINTFLWNKGNRWRSTVLPFKWSPSNIGQMSIWRFGIFSSKT